MNTKMRMKIPASIKAEIRKRSTEVPPSLLPEDRATFIRSVTESEQESQAGAEAHWNSLVNDNEDAHRQWRQKHPEGHDTKRQPYFLTVDQVAIRWNMSARTVWRMVREKRLPSRLIGSSRRVLEEDVERFETQDMAVA